MKYLNKFDTKSDYQASASTLEIPNVAYITATTEVIYNATVKTYIVFADPLVEQKCATLYGDGVGCTEEDLGAVTAMSASDWCGTSITSFDELQYFTGLTTINVYTFQNCSGLTSVTIPNSVTSIGYSAFEGCSGLASVTISNQVGAIAQYTFFGCGSLSAITIPASVTQIGGGAFMGCPSLSGITFEATTPPATIASDAFYALPTTGNITVPVGSEENYYDLARSIGADWTVNYLTPPAPPVSNYVLFEATATTAASDVTELTLDGVTISGNTYGTGGVMFNNTNGYRFYKGCIFDIIATGGNITKIEFTQVSSSYAITNLSPEDSTVGTYTCADGVGTWVASDAVSTVSFNSNAAATRCTSIKVYLE